MMKTRTSWEKSHTKYSKNMNKSGDYFHEQVIIPRLLENFNLEESDNILDLACGEGILSRNLNVFNSYLGIDISKGLIEEARRKNNNIKCEFLVSDVSKRLQLKNDFFTHIFIILALQNIENIYSVLQNALNSATQNGVLHIVINHPYYRIPKSSSWEIDSNTGYQYRKVTRYMSEHKIRIDMNPGIKKSKNYTYSFHYPLWYISELLNQVGFNIIKIQEWVSEKVSEGRYKDREDFSRKEFPMFMYIQCKKI